MINTPQIFISSTYLDLKTERSRVIEAIYELHCTPRCMEHFVASDWKQMKYIKRQIDICDCVILILAGRYGSIDKDTKTRIGFVEEEFDYALEKNKPILVFEYSNIGELEEEKTEKKKIMIKKRTQFHQKATNNRLAKRWHNADDLKTKVILSLKELLDRIAPGFLRDEVSEESRDKLSAIEHLLADSREQLNTIEQLVQFRDVQQVTNHLFYKLSINNFLDLPQNKNNISITKQNQIRESWTKYPYINVEISTQDSNKPYVFRGRIDYSSAEWFLIIGNIIFKNGSCSAGTIKYALEDFVLNYSKHMLFFNTKSLNTLSRHDYSSYIITDINININEINTLLYLLKKCDVFINSIEEIDISFIDNVSILDKVQWKLSTFGIDLLFYYFDVNRIRKDSNSEMLDGYDTFYKIEQ